MAAELRVERLSFSQEPLYEPSWGIGLGMEKKERGSSHTGIHPGTGHWFLAVNAFPVGSPDNIFNILMRDGG